MKRFIVVASLLVLYNSVTASSNSPKDLLASHCFECHDEDTEKGGVQLDSLFELPQNQQLELISKAAEWVYLEKMPPKEKSSLTIQERQDLLEWFDSKLLENQTPTLAKKLRYPSYGNYVNHEKLFSGEIQDQAYTLARRWLVSPQIFGERVLDIFQLKGEERHEMIGEFWGVTNPFVLPEHSGVRYYDHETLSGGHLLVMLKNAKWISWKQIQSARMQKRDLPENSFPNPNDRWNPKSTPAAFAEIIQKEERPTDKELEEAIQKQFQLVLRRSPSPEELSQYLSLTKEAIRTSGNIYGLRYMLLSVLLESEFLYRTEFGAVEPDQHGRKKLSPKEAAYAISYAIGDRSPDQLLFQAVADGNLQTKDDYRREVQRLLDNETYYRKQLDPNLNSEDFQSLTTSHPRIIRFFREFFGYPSALKVFKDEDRSDGYFMNPVEDSTQTPGRLINECDLLVDWVVKQDKDVFETLLTTPKFFVAPVDNASGTINGLSTVYNRLKDSDWKKDPVTIADKYSDFLKEQLGESVDAKALFFAMSHTASFQKRNLRPHPVWDTPFGSKLTPWVESYNLKSHEWNYPLEQPFKLPHRKGILSHPAWLIAHSQNTATDPIRRGKWIREKLLAGHVPDLPITVDAHIPEHPKLTLRERLEHVTHKEECWKCHKFMNPLGLPFEIYDDFGRFRTQEKLEHPDNETAITPISQGALVYKTKTLNSEGELQGTGDPRLDGEVKDALEMISKLVQSKRVRQSIIRLLFDSTLAEMKGSPIQRP